MDEQSQGTKMVRPKAPEGENLTMPTQHIPFRWSLIRETKSKYCILDI